MSRVALRACIRYCHKAPDKRKGLTCEDTVPVAEKAWQPEQEAGGTRSPQTGRGAVNSGAQLPFSLPFKHEDGASHI